MEYRTLSIKEAEKELAAFPDIDARRLEWEVNNLFQPYLFFHKERDHLRLWCSACGKEGTMDYMPQTVTPAISSVLYGEHNEKGICPWCGKELKLKNTARLGKRKNLLEYHPVVFLDEKDGNLYARCYWARKNYIGALNAPPEFMIVQSCIFTPGKATKFSEDYYGRPYKHELVDNYDPVHRVITEPFTESCFGGYRYVPYFVWGLDAIARSSFKYCQYVPWWQGNNNKPEKDGAEYHGHLMKYLAAACIYPRQIEMLAKHPKLVQLVDDLVCGRCKNKDVIRWGEDDPRKAFRLNKQELRGWMDAGASTQTLRWYKRLRRKKISADWETLQMIDEKLARGSELIQKAIEWQTNPRKLYGYLAKQDERRGTISRWFQIWKDWLDMAGKLGFDLENETIRFPAELQRRHDEADAELQRRKAYERLQEQKEQLERARGSLERRRKKYNIEAEGYFIRIAENVDEIVKEGKTLQHCVGGYASRHMLDTTTILFLRRSETPEASLYTIEMDGNTLRQIHGFKNDAGREDPRRTMAWLLDPWLDWLKRGSPRTKAGAPSRLKIQKANEQEAKTA